MCVAHDCKLCSRLVYDCMHVYHASVHARFQASGSCNGLGKK